MHHILKLVSGCHNSRFYLCIWSTTHEKETRVDD
ncbi:hypothetical protein Goarm_005358 [Gossypium armourianum]|uniref:Uncharacterized protein n=1 Tax=Gossypium armourianum TaxID=34283 RepID=A0A7J9JZM3_9ROSI|nr:hypothetical protein [Gossypium armourianum]